MGVWIETQLWKYFNTQVLKSHPVWVCGLKRRLNEGGEWTDKSHPVWVCGLKPEMDSIGMQQNYVTPCMGVWIETRASSVVISATLVTPCMGVWIETLEGPAQLYLSKSHPVWVCGLKRA